VDRDDRVSTIVLPAEHLLDFARLHILFERIQASRQFRDDRFAGFRPLDEHGEIVVAPLERPGEFQLLLDPPPALQGFLRFGLIFPEVRRGGARLEAGQFVFGPGTLKDSSADRRRAC
jgi:hypothetical protein